MQNLEHNLKEIIEIVGTDNLITDTESLSFYSTDIFETAREQAVAIVRPNNADELIQVTQTCIKNEVPVIVRGGGASYTGGYLPVLKNTLIIDTKNLKAIEINEEDMYVTVEPGVTWLELYESLKPLGLRTPFWGPFSGKVATVGGSMSFHALSHGTNNAVSADSLSSLQVVLGNGDIIETGSQGKDSQTSRFFRYYGPDIGGFFLGDSGALGVKNS